MEVKSIFPVVQAGPLYDEFTADWFRYLMLFVYLVAGLSGGLAAWGFIAFWEWLASPEILDF